MARRRMPEVERAVEDAEESAWCPRSYWPPRSCSLAVQPGRGLILTVRSESLSCLDFKRQVLSRLTNTRSLTLDE